MGKIITTDIKFDRSAFDGKLKDLLTNDQTMLQIHNEFARMMQPYVPFEPGENASVTVSPKCVTYSAPYAHYHYEGLVYGPNVPIIEDGIIVGWFSPIKPKHPTGAKLVFKKPQASDHWDKAMMADKREEFIKEVHDILARRAKEIYG